MANTVPVETPEFELTEVSKFDEYSDRELLQYLAARLTDMTRITIMIGEQAPEAFAKFANPMVKLAMNALLK